MLKVVRSLTIILALISLSLPACNSHKKTNQVRKVTVTRPQVKAITISQQYTCQIHAQHHIKIRTSEMADLEAIPVSKGQAVTKGDLIFKIKPIRRQGKRDVSLAEAKLAQLESNFIEKLYEDKAFTQSQPMLEAKRAQAQAKAQLAAAESTSDDIIAPFDGIVDGLRHQPGSLVQEGEVLATLSDTSVMRIYFNVPEARYLEYMTDLRQRNEELQVELILANGKQFQHTGKIDAIAADFNRQTGTISFRADFPNPDRLLRHGQTGTALINRVQIDAVVIPQQATFENLDKRYVYVLDSADVAHQREIVIQSELDDLFVIKSGLGLDDRIIFHGTHQVRDGEKVDIEESVPDEG